MDELTIILLIVVGVPALGLTVIFTTLILKNWWIKSRELKIKEEQMRLEAKNRQDQTNQQIIESHSHNISARELDGVLNDIKTLRDELYRLKADASAARGISPTSESEVQQPGELTRRMQDKNA